MHTLEEILCALKEGKKAKYLLFSEMKDKNSFIKAKKNKVILGMIKETEAYAKETLKFAPPKITFKLLKEFEVSGNRLGFENVYFESRKQLFSLVLSYIFNETNELKEAIEERLWDWCSMYSWELPAHFSINIEDIRSGRSVPSETVALFAAETAFFFSEILYIIGDKLDEFLVYRIRQEIFRRVICPFQNNKFWWESAEMNWASVCAGSVGAAAIYLIDDDKELSKILERVIRSMECFISGFDKDGLTTEGLEYWNYGFSFYVYFSELLRERTASKISLLTENAKVKKIALLPQYLTFPSGYYVNFSDSGSSKITGNYGLMAKLENIFNLCGYKYPDKSDILEDNTYRWAVMVRKVFWGINRKDYSSNTLTGMKYFEDAGWLVDRREIDGSFVCFAAKGGNNHEPHNHNDIGHFILHFDGDNIFSDIGSPEYEKQYFSESTRYNYLAASSLGHSVPVINGEPQKEGKEHFAEVLECSNEDNLTNFKIELSKAYSCDTLENFERDFSWNYETLELTLKDNFSFKNEKNEIVENFISNEKPELVEDGKIVIKTLNALCEIKHDHKLRVKIEKCSYKNHMGESASIFRTSIILCDAGKKLDFNLLMKIIPRN